jgi:S1-C subfamily serine protease
MISKQAVFALAKALEGLPVLGTLEGTPAARAGVRYGDVLLSVNGMRTRSAADYVEAKNLRLDGMEIVIFRSGASITLSLTYDAAAEPVDPVKLVAVLDSLRLGSSTEDGPDDDGCA